MSNHGSATNFKFPGDDARLDLTDLYVFPAPDHPGRTVLIIDVNPFWSGMTTFPPFLMPSGFHPDAVYRINIDTDGDARADRAFSFVFSALEDGRQTGTAYYATGTRAFGAEPSGDVLIEATPVGFDADATPVRAGDCRLFIGVRSDPFFADIEGFAHGFQWTGDDSFANKNVLSIALEVPNEMLVGVHPVIGVWATVSLRRNGRPVQVDRVGRPSINPVINPNDVKDEFNTSEPSDDVEKYLALWSEVLQGLGHSPDQATEAARTVLPDILRFDVTRPAAYPNGRLLTDDVLSALTNFLTRGRVTSQGGLAPHDDLLPQFPFVGLPNPLPGNGRPSETTSRQRGHSRIHANPAKSP